MCFPRLDKNIGYAIVTVDFASLKSTFVVETPWGPVDATVVRKPFYDPKKETPKS
jgi:aminomethyltransferase